MRNETTKKGDRSLDKKGYKLLMDLGVTVDLRHDMHEKCIWMTIIFCGQAL